MRDNDRERLGGSEWTKLRKEILLRDQYRCMNCGSSDGLEVHYIVPVSEGGTNTKGNLASLCFRCHNSAHGKSPTETPSITHQDIRRIPSHTDVQKLVMNTRHPMEQAVILTTAKTGIGVGELCNLSTNDVYLETGDDLATDSYDQADWAVSGIPALYIVGPTHDRRYSPRRERQYDSVVPIDDELRHKLMQWAAMRPDDNPDSDVSPFFTRYSGLPSLNAVHHIVESNAKPLGLYEKGRELENITPCALRYYFIRRFDGPSIVREYILGRIPEVPLDLETMAAQYRAGAPSFFNR